MTVTNVEEWAGEVLLLLQQATDPDETRLADRLEQITKLGYAHLRSGRSLDLLTEAAQDMAAIDPPVHPGELPAKLAGAVGRTLSAREMPTSCAARSAASIRTRTGETWCIVCQDKGWLTRPAPGVTPRPGHYPSVALRCSCPATERLIANFGTRRPEIAAHAATLEEFQTLQSVGHYEAENPEWEKQEEEFRRLARERLRAFGTQRVRLVEESCRMPTDDQARKEAV